MLDFVENTKDIFGDAWDIFKKGRDVNEAWDIFEENRDIHDSIEFKYIFNQIVKDKEIYKDTTR